MVRKVFVYLAGLILFTGMFTVLSDGNLIDVEGNDIFSGFKNTDCGNYFTRVIDEKGTELGYLEFCKIKGQFNLKLVFENKRYDLVADPDGAYLFVAPGNQVAEILIDGFGNMEFPDENSKRIAESKLRVLKTLFTRSVIFKEQVSSINNATNMNPDGSANAPCTSENRIYFKTIRHNFNKDATCFGAKYESYHQSGYPVKWYCSDCNCTKQCSDALTYWTCKLTCFGCED